MLNWYLRTHAWNRIALPSALAAPVVKAIVATPTLEHMIGLPVGAAVFWGLGWAAIGTTSLLQRLGADRTRIDLRTAQTA